MFDDDDDVEPQLKVVDKYYFEEGKDKPVCFSVLPLKFDENEVAGLNSKKLDLRGFADNGLQSVCKQVVAWRVVLNCEKPEISVLSSEGNWIGLSKPRKCYGEEIARSILITVQMLHFVRRRPKEHKKSLWRHLCEVFNKFDTKPVEGDLRKHRPLIKLFVERNPTLMKSKILQKFIEDTSGKIKQPKNFTGTKEPLVVSDESLASSNDDDDDDDDSDYSESLASSNEDGDSDYNESLASSSDNESLASSSDNDGDYDDKDDNSDDDYSYSDNDDNGDGDTDNDDGGGTDPVCAICDNGGNLLSCEGRCKRSFHPREEDGRESNCDTLGYTSAQLKEKEIGTFLCKNCEYKQHQCFKCGELEPSDGPNAKVFQCNNASCGRFYHPKCVAKLLVPDDTDVACELEKRFVAGMSFTCPVHWCCECRSMEDRTQRALQLAVCRRCPKSYHRKCLPSEISFKKKRGTSIHAWDLSKRIIIYCKCHDIVDAIGTPRRDHIKVPSIAEIDQTRDLAKNIVENPFVDKDAELDDESFSAGKDKDVSAREKTSEHYSGKEIGIPMKDAVHANQEQKDELVIPSVENHAEGDEHISGKDRDTQRGENAYGHDSISGREREISRRENRMGLSTYGLDLRSGNNGSSEFGSINKGMTQDLVDDIPPERQVQVAYVEKTTITNRNGTHLECGCDVHQEVEGSYACQHEPKSLQCNNNIKATKIDTSKDKSRMCREPNEQATDGKKMNSDRNRKNLHMKIGRDTRYEDERTAHPQAHKSPQSFVNHKEPDVLGYKFRNNDLNSPRRNDDRRAAEASEYKSRERRGSKSREESRNSMREKSYRDNSPMGRSSARKRSRDYPPEG